VRRIFAAWLALTYVCASAAGAAGFASCVHGTHGGADHGSHVAGQAGAHGHAHGTPQGSAHEVCAGAHDQTARGQGSADHGSTDSCGCLGDCSMGAASAEVPRCEPLVPTAALDREEAVTVAGLAIAPVRQYVLPYPNAPPLSWPISDWIEPRP
jgi:hypothetical protein